MEASGCYVTNTPNFTKLYRKISKNFNAEVNCKFTRVEKDKMVRTYASVHIYIYIYIYMVSQEECARLREGVPYVKVYRYNPRHLCPNLNGYGDNGQRKVWSTGGVHAQYLSADSLIHCPSMSVVSYDGNSAHASPKLHMYFLQGDDVVSHVTSVLGIHVSCIVLGILRTTMT